MLFVETKILLRLEKYPHTATLSTIFTVALDHTESWILLAAFALIRGRWPQLARISVPWSATYVTNVRYSLGESRVRYVRGARSCIIYPPRVTSSARAPIGAHATRDSSPRADVSQEEKSVREETPPEYRRVRIYYIFASITRHTQVDFAGQSCLLEMSRTRIRLFKFHAEIRIQERWYIIVVPGARSLFLNIRYLNIMTTKII